MNKKIFKIVIFIIVILVLAFGVMFLIDLNKMKNGQAVVFSTWGFKYAPYQLNKVNENNSKNYTKYSKEIDNTKIELEIPNEWSYQEVPLSEENPSYKYALKLYKNNENQYAMLYLYDKAFGVCGTERTSKDIVLNNGNEATIGYYDGNNNWSDISFYQMDKYFAVLNNGLADNDAEEVIEFIKTINIETKQGEYSFCGTITQVETNLFFVEPDEDEEIRKSADTIMVQRLKCETNVKFEVGERVKITYDGSVMTTSPLQIRATKIEAANN